MNIPNTITLIRVVLIPFFINLMIYGYYREALIVFLVAGVTDALDGMIARLTKTKSELGAFLDPMADKLLVVSSFVTMALLDKLPIWLVIIVVSRDVILALGSMVIYFMGRDITVRPSLVGKATTFFQLVVVGVSLIVLNYGAEPAMMPMVQGIFWVTAALTIASGVQYVVRGMKIVG